LMGQYVVSIMKDLEIVLMGMGKVSCFENRCVGVVDCKISKIESKGGFLNLLSSPSSISFSHVLWWLD